MTTAPRTLTALTAAVLTVTLAGCAATPVEHTAPAGDPVVAAASLGGNLGFTLTGQTLIDPLDEGRFTVPIPVVVDAGLGDTATVVCGLPKTILTGASIQAADTKYTKEAPLTRFLNAQASLTPDQVVDAPHWFYLAVDGKKNRVELATVQDIKVLPEPEGAHSLIVTVAALTSNDEKGVGFWFTCGGRIDRAVDEGTIRANAQTRVIDFLHDYLSKNLTVTIHEKAQTTIVDETTLIKPIRDKVAELKKTPSPAPSN